MTYLLIYLVVINILGYSLMMIDKKRAIKHQYRISERTLWITAILFGALGLFIGMKNFRHKTKHALFKYGLPILSVLELGIVLYVLNV
ncbi:DUF1294 domain-containing protein [Cytobacillus oceanisediminis]|uniref:DUF1294 domain-containing protein n=2 Tax=Niallia TaxID=2837506 RepID=A0A941JM02_NIACI|nr:MULTISPECIES: DUF1294 domain-containing protein [Bacillaceae]MBQ6448140.1 DUF1294 domain-containing protein [Bacillus sp. (in: firmicutes)]MDU1844236.1 DUF1294 domain-containing protein [Niallia nealsonii]MBZ9533324.1 DUF1294 domain-containing protein [Cytobacillus oceanisediminis]MCB5238103.1 DUF1294 domain-containing protein [Niallia circulans]MED3792980.1 DUF1294 domain-containing protein [Niallia alba]